MAGIRGRSGPPGNQNAFRHGLSTISERRNAGILSDQEQTVRDEILDALIADKGGPEQISTATKILAQLIASDSALLVSFNKAIDQVLVSNEKARENPKALAQLDSYRRPVMSSLSANLAKFGFDRTTKVESLETIIAELQEENRSASDHLTGTNDPS